MEKIRIYEIAGIPGSGKTTVFNDIIGNFNNVYTRQHLLDICARKGFLVSILSCLYFRYTTRLNKFLNSYPKSPDFLKQALLSLYVLTKITKLLHPQLSFVYDEGFVQNISAIPYRLDLKDDTVLNKLIEIINSNFEVVVIYLDIDNDEAIRRIRNRNSNYRFEVLNDTELDVYLKTKRNNIKLAMSKFDKVIYYSNTNDLIEELKNI